jgi:hypothetical protein
MSFRMDRRTVFTLGFVLALLGLVLVRTGGYRQILPAWFTEGLSPRAANGPEDSIYAMLDAARAGDTRAYLDAFSNPVREQLFAVVRENSEAKFAEYLKVQNSAFQSVAVSVLDRMSDSEVQARVEYVYPNRNEVQSLSLRKESSRWRIFKIEGANQIQTPVPLGAGVNE